MSRATADIDIDRLLEPWQLEVMLGHAFGADVSETFKRMADMLMTPYLVACAELAKQLIEGRVE